MDQLLTQGARELVVKAQEYAQSMQHAVLEPDHLLYALVNEESVGADLMLQSGTNLNMLSAAINDLLQKNQLKQPPLTSPPHGLCSSFLMMLIE